MLGMLCADPLGVCGSGLRSVCLAFWLVCVNADFLDQARGTELGLNYG